MNARLYVANLPHCFTEEEIEAMFSEYGIVESVQVMPDKLTGRPRGVAYVGMDCRENALLAMAVLNGTQFEGRNLIVNKNWGERKSPIEGIDRRAPLEEDSFLVAV